MENCGLGSNPSVVEMTEQDLNDTREFWQYHLGLLHRAMPTYKLFAYIFMALGLFGNTLSMITLKRGASMQTAHFVFYKFMTAAELIYCINFFVSQIFESLFLVHKEGMNRRYLDETSAYYCYVVARFLYSSTGYIVLYMALIISADRFTALWCTKLYQITTSKQKKTLALGLCWTAVFLSTFVHSWSAFWQKIVFPRPEANGTVAYIAYDRSQPTYYVKMKKVKDIYNMIVRVSYPIVLLALTIGVIWGFLKYQAHRRLIVNNVSRSADIRRHAERRRERNLFYLMVAVVILAFIQVVHVETKRFLGIVQSKSSIMKCLNKLHVLSVEHARKMITFLITQHWMGIAANLATQIDRSLKFYLYIILNSQFREEVVNVLCTSRSSSQSERSRGQSYALISRYEQNGDVSPRRVMNSLSRISMASLRRPLAHSTKRLRSSVG